MQETGFASPIRGAHALHQSRRRPKRWHGEVQSLYPSSVLTMCMLSQNNHTIQMKVALCLALSTTVSAFVSQHHQLALMTQKNMQRHLQNEADFDTLCQMATSEAPGAICTCDFASLTIGCESTAPLCENGVCFETKTSLVLTEDLADLAKTSACVDFISGAPSGLESGCFDIFLEAGVPTDCDMFFGGVQCNECRVCSSDAFGNGSLDLDCANIRSFADTNGCRPFGPDDGPASLFPDNSGAVVPTAGILGLTAAVVTTLM